MRRLWIALIVTGCVAAAAAPAAPAGFVPAGARDKCPVCGMFVARYAGWMAEVVYRDGGYAVFDGCKDLFRYYFALRTYAPARSIPDIKAVYVTDYYSLEPVDGLTAWYVLGSDVYGPMGKELIPFAVKADAAGFLGDHHGERILKLADIEAVLPRLIE